MARGLVALVSLLGLGAATLGSSRAHAAPIELVEPRGQYLLFDDVDGSVENANWFFRDPFFLGYEAIEQGLLAVHPDDSQFIVVYTTWSLPAGIGAFFQSVANDVEGIGFEHIANEDPIIPAPYFDDTPDSQVQGMLHMNRWTQYLGSDPGGVSEATISLIFGQELGHAWGSFVYFNQGTGWETSMLGRANAHWSFYLHSGGSPMQGHQWLDNGDGTFTATKPELYVYSDLDLYLMGLLPAQDVAPWFLLDNPSNCVDAASGDGVCADPQAFLFEADSYTVSATRRDIAIEDVLAVEGARVPAFPEAPDEFDVSFLLIKRPDETLDEDELLALDAIIERTISLFELQTRGLGRVNNRTASAPPGGGDTGEDETGTDSGGTGGSGDGPDLDGTASGADPSETEGSGNASGSGPGQDGAGDGGADGGCGCSSSSQGPAGRGVPAALLLLLWPLRRRRVPRR